MSGAVRWIDLSHPLDSTTPPFPGDPRVRFQSLDETQETGDHPREHLNCGHLSLPIHAGTHLDAPFHFFGDGATVDAIELAQCNGPAICVQVELTGERQAIDVEHLAAHEDDLRAARRALICTGWDRQWQQPHYFDRHPFISRPAAETLVQWGVRLLGVDFPSVDFAPHEAHRVLLGNGVILLENLTQLQQLPKTEFELACLPLKISGGDGSPVRVAARLM